MDQLLTFMEAEGLDVIFINDSEKSRDINMRYVTGHPMDATLVVSAGGETCLIPWDLQLAEDHAEVDIMLNFQDYDDRWLGGAVHYITETLGKEAPVIGVNGDISYQYIIELKERLPEAKIIDEPIKVANKFRELRTTKSLKELDLLLEAGKIGNKTIKDIIAFAEEKEGTELDLSFLVMKKMRESGAEDNSFPSLVANTERAHMIHCHPMAGTNHFAKEGLALIDFGALYEGYASDITIPFAFGKLTEEQKKIRKTVMKAYEAAIEAIDLGVPLWKISDAAVNVIEAAGYKMPHSLGHGLGLAVHDAPGVRPKPTNELLLRNWEEYVVEDGMVFTIEPGVYVKGLGGQRWENDVMIRNGKPIVYTESKPVTIE
jgi:Xaa-Pro dipeptidase